MPGLKYESYKCAMKATVSRATKVRSGKGKTGDPIGKKTTTEAKNPLPSTFKISLKYCRSVAMFTLRVKERMFVYFCRWTFPPESSGLADKFWVASKSERKVQC